MNAMPKAFSATSNAQFLMLGSETAEIPEMQPLLRSKIAKTMQAPVPGVWATLGMANNEALLWTGNLQFSRSGNDRSVGRTLEEVKALYQINEELNAADNKVIENFINFDEINFPDFPETFTEETMPQLRLTVFLQPDQGALVFFQHFKKSYKTDKDSEIEYIQPEATPGFSTDRDRLTYIFPMLPKQKIVETAEPGVFKLEGPDLGKSFVIKVLTFKRNNDDHKADVVVNKIMAKVGQGKGKYKLLKFIYSKNEFYEVNDSDVLLDPQAKTLLLIHGTFSSTDNSYNGLLKKEYDNGSKSWLQKTMQTKGYLQIIALDHPTVSDDAKDNIDALLQILNGFSFEGNPNVDVITTSRGGLVGRYITNCMGTNKQLPIRKMVNIACANGVGYFDTGRQIARFLSIWKVFLGGSGNPLGAAVVGLAQFSAEYFLQLPGCQQMTIGSDRLNNIINSVPSGASKQVVIQPIIGDWDASLVENEGLIKRLAERGLDLLIKSMLGKEHDWVVGTEKQRIAPAGALAPIQVRSMHVRYLNSDVCPDKVHEKIWNFLGA